VDQDIFERSHYNVHQLRTDIWNELKHAAFRLQSGRKSKPAADDPRARIEKILKMLWSVERFWAYPGLHVLQHIQALLRRDDHEALAALVSDFVKMLVSGAYRSNPHNIRVSDDGEYIVDTEATTDSNYFEVLFVDELDQEGEATLKSKITEVSSLKEPFTYDVVVAPSFEDALIALYFNYNIQACVVRYGIPYKAVYSTKLIKPFIQDILRLDYSNQTQAELGPILGRLIKEFRPELDVYYVTDTGLTYLKDSTISQFRRIFYSKEDLQEVHLSILRGIKERYETPFFDALKEFSQRPTGVFHAMPISRGNSVFKSHWLKDLGAFYGRNIFLAETSATTGGLDSLLQPTGPIKRAQELAAKAFQSKQTYFVTNGTSTANKIVHQALLQPGDVVLIDRECHKSHHYGLVLVGAYPVYLSSYPIDPYVMYGAVTVKEIVAKLQALKEAGRLDQVKMLLLTNCTFDGIVYHVERVMEEVLAIKPDMIFLWDEAWFAFGAFTSTTRQRTAMYAARKLHDKYRSDEYKAAYQRHIRNGKDGKAMPDPDKVRIRVYATQSTHKTLSSLRQGSMIHVWDELFHSQVADAFNEAYMTHTSTSANYQILASLDAGRRQTQFEGYEMVEKAIEMAMVLRAKVNGHSRLNRYFKILTIWDLIPDASRETGLKEYFDPESGWNRMEDAWATDEFVLDPTKLTLYIGRTGIDGNTFKNRFLMDQFGIQVNKTSPNTVLFMTNIGSTRSSVAYLMRVLLSIADQLDEENRSLGDSERAMLDQRIQRLTQKLPPLPEFSGFHDRFLLGPGLPGGDIRSAFFLANDVRACEFIPLSEMRQVMRGGREIVSAGFVTPYPPGFPVLVPGQIMSETILEYLLQLDVSEIHGYRPGLGLRVFSERVLSDRLKNTRTAEEAIRS
jgi:arginine decarboxylase